MKESWSLFWSDYANLAGESIRFFRNHWLGMLIFMVPFALYMIGICAGWFDELLYGIEAGCESLKTRIASVFKKGKHEKE